MDLGTIIVELEVVELEVVEAFLPISPTFCIFEWISQSLTKPRRGRYDTILSSIIIIIFTHDDAKMIKTLKFVSIIGVNID